MASILKVDTIQDQSGNNIINESSDTITIGASGDTVNIVGTLQNNGSGLVSGITEADQFRLSTTLSADGQVITANWERVDTNSGGIIGTGITESSGIFSFPSTGIYLVNIDSVITKDAARLYAGIYIQVSTDGGSTYSTATETFGSIYASGSAAQLHGSFLLDVTSTANIKVRFYAVAAGVTTYDGSTTINRTYATFIRLGDT
jgi:hypothetical protein